MIIDDESVSKIHCKIEVLDSGRMALTNLSAKGTWLNGIKLIKRTLVKPDDELRLGPTYTVQVKELLTQENYNAYTNYIYVAERYKTKGDLEAFINAAAKYSAGNMPNYVMPVVKVRWHITKSKKISCMMRKCSCMKLVTNYTRCKMELSYCKVSTLLSWI